MDKKEFKKLIKKDKYQLFLFESPVSLPFSLFIHYWFVCVEKGKTSRWEVLFRKNKNKKRWGHLYLNFLPPTIGIEIIPFYQKYFWKGKLRGNIEGDRYSLAKKMIDFIKKTKRSYPYLDKYNLVLGPNSNTFIQWVIDKFPESGFKLSWRATGKNYRE